MVCKHANTFANNLAHKINKQMAAVCHKYTLMKIPKHRFTQKKHHHYFLACIKLPNVGNFCLLACVCDAANEINTTIWLGFVFYDFCCFLLANVLVETSLECHKIQIFCRWANFLVDKKNEQTFRTTQLLLLSLR